MPSNHLIRYHPLLLLTSIFPRIRVFSNESTLRIRWAMYWSFSFSISLCTEYSGLISFRIDWFDLHAVQGTLKSLLQHHTSKASILWLPVWVGPNPDSVTYALCTPGHHVCLSLLTCKMGMMPVPAPLKVYELNDRICLKCVEEIAEQAFRVLVLIL